MRKRKIAGSEWKEIIARYEGGESTAQIGRDYNCTGGAIRYIIKKSGKLPGEISADGERHEVGGQGRSPTPAFSILNPLVLKRVTGDIASVLVALDSAQASDSDDHLGMLQSATDSLMRSIARVRIELDHLASGRQFRLRISRDSTATDGQ